MSRKTKAKVVVGAALGGPATVHGVGYQIQYAVYLALDQIVRHFAAPHLMQRIGLEPRTVDPSTGEVLGWDISTKPSLVIWEAKLNATKKDVLEWLEHVRKIAANDQGPTFGFVYGQARSPIVSGLARLRDVAIECNGEAERFDAFVADSEHLDIVQSSLGPTFRIILTHLKFVNAPEELLKNHIRDRAQYLAGVDADRLVALLLQLFCDASAKRKSYNAAQLIDHIREQSIPLNAPPGTALAEVPDTVRAALCVLAECPSGLPGTALAAAVQTDEINLIQALQVFLVQRLVTDNQGILRFAGSRELHPPPDPDMLTSALDTLLSWIEGHETAASAPIVARSAFDLGRISLKKRPGLALKLFQATEHVVKNAGDKHLLLEISELCLQAANDSSPIDRDLKARAKAQAMLCGHCWVYQRIGRLPEARLWADRSERLGENIRWDRNTAFAKKCLGRLDRIEASEATSPRERSELFAESKRKLCQAIELFTLSLEFGPADRQVGDCYSLLARTQFEAGDLANAVESLKKADEIIFPTATKEYFDLKILTAEIETAKGYPDAAEQYLSQVIDTHLVGNRELSEICARAYMRRGELRLRNRRRESGLNDLKRSAQIWQSLAEHELAAEAEWAHISANGQLSQKILHAFSGVEPALVRVSAVNDYVAQLASLNAVAHRAIPTKLQLQRLAQAVRKRTAEEHPQW